MLPYHELQLGYAAVALTLTAILWWASGRFLRRERLFLRWGTTLLAVGAAGIGFQAALRPFGQAVSSLFIAVAVIFYAAGFWLPLMVIVAARRATQASTGTRTVAILLAAIPPAVSLYAMLGEPNRLQFRDEVVPIAAWPAGTKPLLVAHVSDLQTVGPCAREDRALAEVARRRPDLIVMTGDYVGGPFFDTRPAEENARTFLDALCRIAPTIVVAGHSENEEVRGRLFQGLEISYLTDAVRRFDFGDGRRLVVAGLDPFRPDLRLPREPRPSGEALLVVTHAADVTVELEGARVDLHVAGHTHGGQVVVPFFGAPITLTELPRRYARGLFRFGDHWLNVCAGLGMEGNHAPRIRLFCPPEICMLTLTGESTASEGDGERE